MKDVKITETNEYKAKNAMLQAEINHPSTKVNIDRSVFRKSKEERKHLKWAKSKQVNQ
jgi:hypothetical protein